ncbi:MAG: response regulator transcription factor [Chloroflexota bacterium]
MIRVVICDDQAIVTEGLQVILESDSEIEVVGIGHDGAQAIELVEKHHPNIVLMDLKMSGMNGIHATRHIRAHHPDVFVLVLTTYDADEWVFDAIRSGASGYLLKNTPPKDLIKSVKQVVNGENPVDPNVAGTLFKHINQSASTLPSITADTKIDDLSDRELEVLRLMAKGLSNRDIAKQLFLSEGTIRNYVSNVFSKLNVSDRTQASLIAVRYGLVD